VATINNIQYAEKPRAWWLPIPFIEVYGEARNSSKDKLSEVQYGYGAHVGLRIDFK
jgi:hypothetical protein